ncbi:hypothetical protein [Prescottella equi]|uniref:hypothetical protein n=1 Tax=Nocardiaceae TaxID=85025 RepID=UPI00111C82AD|nr:hypothetical protein [Prescottella equi]MBM4599755.1 hypothetical protein [Prescottella equi]NKS33880.1 hypothetical protein [Prescottella equi]BCN55606.1 hypothetical protein RE9425_39960 [Prescottella equi]
MSKINRKLPIALCAVAASAGIALSVAPAASATIGSTTTNFSMSCNGTQTTFPYISQDQAQSYGVTVNHQLSGANQSFAVSIASQTVPTSAFGYTVTGLSNMKIRVQIDGSTYVSHSLSGGSGYTGTATATKKTSTPTGNAIIEIAIPNVAAGAVFTPPTLTVIQGSTVAPKFSTGNGGNGTAATQNEGKYGDDAGNFYAFDSTVTGVPIYGTVTAPTSCLPTDVQFPSTSGAGAFPVLNAGAGVLHS